MKRCRVDICDAALDPEYWTLDSERNVKQFFSRLANNMCIFTEEKQVLSTHVKLKGEFRKSELWKKLRNATWKSLVNINCTYLFSVFLSNLFLCRNISIYTLFHQSDFGAAKRSRVCEGSQNTLGERIHFQRWTDYFLLRTWNKYFITQL